MSLWQMLFNRETENNQHKNHIACVANDCSCLSDEQLLDMLRETDDEDVATGIKQILNARGYSKKELQQIGQILPS